MSLRSLFHANPLHRKLARAVLIVWPKHFGLTITGVRRRFEIPILHRAARAREIAATAQDMIARQKLP